MKKTIDEFREKAMKALDRVLEDYEANPEDYDLRYIRKDHLRRAVNIRVAKDKATIRREYEGFVDGM